MPSRLMLMSEMSGEAFLPRPWSGVSPGGVMPVMSKTCLRHVAGTRPGPRSRTPWRIAFFRALFLFAALAAALVPLLTRTHENASQFAGGFPGWPSHYEGRPLTELPLAAREQAFVRDFPGRVGRFSDGQREIIVRWVAEPTRRLHPASDCFRGSGYTITPLPLQRDAAGTPMGCFRASRHGETMRVCEALRDDHGQTWPDASSWYWTTMLGGSDGPWWSVVVAEKS
jgi:hypothetical protein